MLLGALTVALNIGVLNIAIPSIMSSLGSDLTRVQWVQTAFQIAYTVLQRRRLDHGRGDSRTHSHAPYSAGF